MPADELIKLLSTAFRKEQESNNYKLLKVADSGYTNVEQTLRDVKNAHFTDFASGKSLDLIASLLNIKRKVNESDKIFRARIKLAFSKITNTATINVLKEVIAAAIATKTDRIKIKDCYDVEPATFVVWVWLQDLNAAGITLEDFRELIKTVKPAGVRVQAFLQGTFTYRSIGEESDPTKGYNDLANTNPYGGTYAGLLQL